MGMTNKYIPNPNIPTAADRAPGPFAFVRDAEQIAADDAMHAEDLLNERCDNTIWDRD